MDLHHCATCHMAGVSSTYQLLSLVLTSVPLIAGSVRLRGSHSVYTQFLSHSFMRLIIIHVSSSRGRYIHV